MKYLALAALSAALAGCATSEIVYLKNPNGAMVQCGPYTHYGNIPTANLTTQIDLRDCVTDFQRQGYERVPGPAR